jgi:hypothetical protein
MYRRRGMLFPSSGGQPKGHFSSTLPCRQTSKRSSPENIAAKIKTMALYYHQQSHAGFAVALCCPRGTGGGRERDNFFHRTVFLCDSRIGGLPKRRGQPSTEYPCLQVSPSWHAAPGQRGGKQRAFFHSNA